ncbi:MAG: response regulator, partial [Candidatus Marinimicrobia bacterium]|nr:response regulator [Candidatus Neomarinimicrobiota bacterium]
VMMFTALSDEDMVQKAAELGAVDYLLKPFRLKTIQEKIEEFLQVTYPLNDRLNGKNGEQQYDGDDLPSLVLLVSEDRILKNRFQRILRNNNIKTVNANSSLEGLRLLNTKTPDIIIIDEDLQVFTASEFESKINSNSVWSHIPILKIAEKKTDQTNIISRLVSEDQFLATLSALWESSESASGEADDSDTFNKGRYRLLLMMLSDSMYEYFSYNVDHAFEMERVENSSDLIANILNWDPDFILINYPDYQEDVYGILKRCQGTLGGEDIAYYLFSKNPLKNEVTSRIASSGFNKLIVESESTLDLHHLLYDELGITDVAEVVDGDTVILTQKDNSTDQAGGEILHRVAVNELEGYQNFIIDLTNLEEIIAKEVEDLGKLAQMSDKFQLNVQVVTSCLEVMKALDKNSAARKLTVVSSMDEAKNETVKDTENSSAQE